MDAVENITRVLDLIVCPHCHGSLSFAEDRASIACASCQRRYRIHDGIPVLIPERATS